MRRRPALARAAASAAVTLALLSGCGSDEPTAPTTEPPTAADGSGAGGLLAERGLADRDPRDLIEELDRAEDKPADLMASVRYDELVLTDPSEPEQETALPIEDGFYLSMAPYVDRTHDCYYHSLTTCQGELVEEEVDVTITSAGGEVLVDETVTTYPNGFVGFWLPRDVEATLEVEHDGRSATTEIATGPDDPTCLTTVQLT